MSLRLPGRPAGAIPVRFVVALMVVLVALVALPILTTTLRSSRFSASVEVFPIERPVFGLPRDPVAYLRRLLRDPQLASDVLANIDMRIAPTGVVGHIQIAPFKQHAVVTSWADTPERARVLVDASVLQIANASARALYYQSRAALSATRTRLASRPTAAERTALLHRAQVLEAVIAKPPFGLVAGPRPDRLRPAGAVDRLVDALPGPFPPRPGIVEPSLIGLVLAFFLSFVIWQEYRKLEASATDHERNQ
jgi:hypothetical protein